MAKPKSKKRTARTSLGYTDVVHAQLAEKNYKQAESSAQDALKHARAGDCGAAFDSLLKSRASLAMGVADELAARTINPPASYPHGDAAQANHELARSAVRKSCLLPSKARKAPRHKR